jgi:hypothetical protein
MTQGVWPPLTAKAEASTGSNRSASLRGDGLGSGSRYGIGIVNTSNFIEFPLRQR